MKLLFFALCVVFAFGGVNAQTNVWQPSPGHTQVPIWPGAVPDAQPVAGPETTQADKDLVAGRPWVHVDNVSRPNPDGLFAKGEEYRRCGSRVPWRGYKFLAIDLQGTEVCDWLASRGITAVLLKHRVPTERVGPYRESPSAL